MLTDKIQLLKQKRAEVEALEKETKEELRRELASLPGKFGFAGPKELYDAILAAKKRGGITPGAHRKPKTDLTEELKDKVMAMTAQRTPAESIAKELGISLGSVANIRRERAPKPTPSAAGT